MQVKLFTASGPGEEPKLVSNPVIRTAHYPEVILFGKRVFLQTPVMDEYREVQAYNVRSPPGFW